jgi:WD40 repeat protein
MLRGTEEPAMPFEDEKLPEEQIALVERWITQGAMFDGPNKDVPLPELTAEASSPAAELKVPAPVAALAFHPDGNTVAMSGYHEIVFWSTATGQIAGRWATRAERVQDIEYAADGSWLAHAGGSPGKMGEVVAWSVAEGKPIRALLDAKDVQFALAIRPGTRELAAGGTDRIFRVWNVDSGQELHAVENHADWILSFAYTPDGKKLITGSRDRTAKVWDQTTVEPLLTFAQHTDAVYAVASGADGATAFSAGADRHLRGWKTDGNGEQTLAVPAHGDVITSMVFAAQSKIVYTTGIDRKVIAWNAVDGKAIREFVGHEDVVYSLALSRDEQRLASGSYNGDVRVWNTQTGEMITRWVVEPVGVAASP